MKRRLLLSALAFDPLLPACMPAEQVVRSTPAFIGPRDLYDTKGARPEQTANSGDMRYIEVLLPG
ncbi:hypothetical protein [Mameliella sp.]|uniref:hypothetical protein n=1 Tax=Mameliella sp. TaxID=1924940 RepID=UPI003B503017